MIIPIVVVNLFCFSQTYFDFLVHKTDYKSILKSRHQQMLYYIKQMIENFFFTEP